MQGIKATWAADEELIKFWCGRCIDRDIIFHKYTSTTGVKKYSLEEKVKNSLQICLFIIYFFLNKILFIKCTTYRLDWVFSGDWKSTSIGSTAKNPLAKMVNLFFIFYLPTLLWCPQVPLILLHFLAISVRLAIAKFKCVYLQKVRSCKIWSELFNFHFFFSRLC